MIGALITQMTLWKLIEIDSQTLDVLKSIHSVENYQDIGAVNILK